jgi:hypothetical protein
MVRKWKIKKVDTHSFEKELIQSDRQITKRTKTLPSLDEQMINEKQKNNDHRGIVMAMRWGTIGDL